VVRGKREERTRRRDVIQKHQNIAMGIAMDKLQEKVSRSKREAVRWARRNRNYNVRSKPRARK